MQEENEKGGSEIATMLPTVSLKNPLYSQIFLGVVKNKTSNTDSIVEETKVFIFVFQTDS
jgi:hypothetical protein